MSKSKNALQHSESTWNNSFFSLSPPSTPSKCTFESQFPDLEKLDFHKNHISSLFRHRLFYVYPIEIIFRHY